MNYSIAETFHSIKGEGFYTGVAMKFIRFAGCNVGRDVVVPTPALDSIGPPPLVGPHMTEKTDARVCHTHDGRPFWCDTDFHKYEELNEVALLEDVWEERVVLTGGEPLIHLAKLGPLVDLAHENGLKLHLETSGTISWLAPTHSGEASFIFFDWIAVAPKIGYIPRLLSYNFCNEIKLLVDADFREETIPPEALVHPRVYLQPVNPPYGLDKENLQRCLDIQRKHPTWIISPQLHKLLGVK